jgi:anti-sigma regulatory factor (Ser/Thr protein kinase)
MVRLRDGDTVDIDAEAPAAEVPSARAGADEIDQVQHAFNTVHRAAVQAAVEEANLRRGVSSVFRNLARRNQALLHRQLGLLDGMERRADEPEQLEDLFRIDHLTTRMRRHAEGLIVLSGESPGRNWTQPVLFIDVLRAAVAEVESYARIRVEVRSKAALAGPAVADVVHLLAELMENATVFSPPNTMVRVQGELVGRGFAVEIEDRGLGIAQERLEELNRDLASLPAFDPAGSDRLGLFVTGRLAHRHGIRVSLRSSVYGGTSAVVVIPTSLVVTAADSQLAARETAGRALEPVAAAAALSSAGVFGASGNEASGNEASGNEASGNEANGHDGNRERGNGHGGNGHDGNRERGNGHGADGLQGYGPEGNGLGGAADWRSPRHAAPAASTPQPDDSQPVHISPPAPSGHSGWPAPRTLASRVAGDSVQAGQVVAGATELVPGPGTPGRPAGQQDGELPVRVRQESLAPQLRDRDAADSGTFAPPPGSAEALRNTMSTMQLGWERGRSATAGPSEDAEPGAASAGQNPADQGGE